MQTHHHCEQTKQVVNELQELRATQRRQVVLQHDVKKVTVVNLGNFSEQSHQHCHCHQQLRHQQHHQQR